MKKILFTTLIIIFSATLSLNAQSQRRELAIMNQKVEREGDQVVISFRANVGRKVAKSGETVIYSPAISDGTNRWSLPSIVVRGRRAKIANERNEWASGATAFPIDHDQNKIAFVSNGSSFDYKVAINWQSWMNNSDLIVERLDMGCCSTTEYNDRVLLSNVLPPPIEVVPEPIPKLLIPPEYEEKEMSTGDKLAQKYSFVRHAGEFGGMVPGEMERDRGNSKAIYFHQGKYNIDFYLADNYRTLNDILESLRTLQSSQDIRISHVVIAGFASPEGDLEFNNRLAYNRANAVMWYIYERIDLGEAQVMIYNGGEDWYGLREMVERSDLYEKHQILHIIDNYPIENSSYQPSRKRELQRLNGGKTYQHLYRYFYPQLRNAAYIKVYYEER